MQSSFFVTFFWAIKFPLIASSNFIAGISSNFAISIIFNFKLTSNKVWFFLGKILFSKTFCISICFCFIDSILSFSFFHLSFLYFLQIISIDFNISGNANKGKYW